MFRASRRQPTRLLAFAMVAMITGQAAAAAATVPASTTPCRIDGVPTELQCGVLKRALDPARPQGTQIDVHYVIAPAMARNKQPDPVLVLAGGPGQSAISLAGSVLPRLSRLNNRRDIVLIDQRGTGKSAPLMCPDESKLPLAEGLNQQLQLQRLQQCRESLEKLPYGDLRFFTTSIAMQDFDAVRDQLGVAQWNLYGASYGTRAALEYQRQFPEHVRRNVIDGVAPPDMVLPASTSSDIQAALDAVFAACEKESACQARYPRLREQWRALLASLPRQISLAHPSTGEPQQLTLHRSAVLNAVRSPLYMPVIASGLPAAIQAASAGRFEGLLGLSGVLASGRGSRMATGMHFSVVCAEDMPRLSQSRDLPGADIGRNDIELYTEVCKTWPRGEVQPAFYTMPPARTPVLLLSGGADPVTPPRHGERAKAALGALAKHLVVPASGHGVLTLGCMRDQMFRFIDAREDAEALKVDAGCAAQMPRPGAYLPQQLSEVQP
ncbi:alpha/beta fold hydrolase [Paucibacter sp. APW11]|uniref:Alpha/beta fold hydrolase n=1 Tax=Roseateles aquae TaxID=3077235 RepID=A0ABU3PG91_9BURK|nr:alpha/beta fold hydrolase [Paucibacter sp. APW11]MDT9001620.1 alpha/beta fold hydrolase [Paucibacter sp. APW11]